MLQVRHALQSQFNDSIPNLEVVIFADIALGDDPKKLISNLYNHLLIPSATTHTQHLRAKWETDTGEIDDEQWEEILSTSTKVSPKLSDCLTHLYILHRSYLTPARILKYKPDTDPACPHCGAAPSTFYHFIWSCLPIQHYWSQIVKFLHDCMGSPLTLCPRQCLLGLLPVSEEEKYLSIFLQETLFTARMQIAQLWLRPTSPTTQQWKRAVNLTLPYKKVLYTHHGCPGKYHKIWDRWLNESSTCTD